MPIFDQGYQHWDGTLTSHAWRWWAITKQGVRTQLASRWTRVVLILALLPALALVTLIVLWGLLLQNQEMFAPFFQEIDPLRPFLAAPKEYTNTAWTLMYQFYFQIQLYICMFVVVLVGPSLISQDLRFNALPLYFSRPITRFDYFLGKLGVIGVILACVAILPVVLAYICGVALSFDWGVLTDTIWLVPASIAYGAVIVLTAGTIVLALSSLTRNSRLVGGMWIAFWLISGAVANGLLGVEVGMIHYEEYSKLEQRQEQMGRELAELTDERSRLDRNDPDWQSKNRKLSLEIDKRERELNFGYQQTNRRANKRAIETMHTSWRHILSFTANLHRIRRVIFQPQEAWRKAASLINPRDPEFAFKQYSEPAFPWYWSAGVLLALIGLSLWILNRRVKTMDRLR